MSTPPRWFVRRLELTNFRCFDELSIDFDSELTVLIGENGAGKTAVLDGLAVMLSTALSALGDSRRGFDISDIRLRPQGTSGQSVPSMEAIMPIGGQIHAVLAGEDYHWWRQKTSLKGRTGWGDKHLIDAHVGNMGRRERGATNDCATRCRIVWSRPPRWRPSCPRHSRTISAGCIFGCPRQ